MGEILPLNNPILKYNERNTLTLLNKLDKLGIYFKIKDLSKYIRVNEKTLRLWEIKELLFPIRDVNNYRIYKPKDVLRALIIKYLKDKYKIRDLSGVRLILELVYFYLNNLKITNITNTSINIDRIEIDKFIMRALDCDLDKIAYVSTFGTRKAFRYE